MSKNDRNSRDQPFEVVKVDVETGRTTIVVQRGIIGPMGNQLRATDTNRKASSILRKLGYVLKEAGDIQYGADVNCESELKEVVCGELPVDLPDMSTAKDN